MTIAATPMNDAAERYSPEIAEAFQPTDTERPATKKSPAVLEVFAERKPIAIVTTTVTRENARIHGSTSIAAKKGESGMRLSGWVGSICYCVPGLGLPLRPPGRSTS